MVEDESDVLAAKELKAEVHADIAEFSEDMSNVNELLDNDAAAMANNPTDSEAHDKRFKEKQSNEMHKLEHEFQLIETEVFFKQISFTIQFYLKLMFD